MSTKTNDLVEAMNEFSMEMISKQGIKFDETRVLPEDITRGKVGDCFDHCFLEAIKSNGKYHYVEGYAFSPFKKMFLHHAWLTDSQYESENHVVYDPTWKAEKLDGTEVSMSEAGFMYVGVIMDLKKLTRFITETEYKAVFENYWRDEKLAREIFV